MRKLLMTSAIVVPFLMTPALAQQDPLLQDQETEAGQETLDAEGTQDDAGEPLVADDADDGVDEPAVADDADAPGEPVAADDDPAAADDPALAEDDPAATDDPALAEDDPAAADEPAVAGDDPAMEDEEAVAEEPVGEAPAAVVTEQAPNELRGDWIIGTSVTSPQDETIGSIQDLIIDEDEGRVTAAILSVGGFLGFGAKNIAVDWNELQIDHDAREVTLDITREEADEAPEYVFRDRAEAPAPAMADPGMAAPPAGDPGMGGGAPLD